MFNQRDTGGMFNMTESVAPVVPEEVEDVKVLAEDNYFTKLASIDVKDYIEKKNGFSYLSWAFAVDQLKRKHPDAKIIVKRFPDPQFGNVMVPFLKTSLGVFVEVEVVINGISASEPFPVLDFRNKPIDKPNAMDINKAIQRAKVKAIAAHGLGLYIYAGEDIPIDENKSNDNHNPNPNGYQNYQQPAPQQQYQQQPPPQQPMMMTQQQQTQMKDIANQIAHLTLGAGATQEGIVAQLGQVYNRHKITANMPMDLANVKINEMGIELKTLIESRMAPPQAQQDAGLFGQPAQDLQDVI